MSSAHCADQIANGNSVQTTQPVSVVVIAYNEERYLSHNLTSLANQTSRNFEVIVVDSNSSDKTEAVARKFANELPGFRYLKLSQAKGPAYGRNRGAEIAANNQLLFLDADTVLNPRFIADTTDELAARGVDTATCPLRILENSTISKVGVAFLNTAMRWLSPVYITAYGACLFSTRQVHDAVGGFNERIGICEDCNYVKKARKQGFRFGVLTPVFHTSNRRARREGGCRIMFQYISSHLWRMFTGREIFREDIYYPYGDF